MNKNCPDFEATRYVCDYFIPNGSCKKQTRFMCHIFIDTDKQPVQDDVPLHLGKVLETFNGSTVVKEFIDDAVVYAASITRGGEKVDPLDFYKKETILPEQKRLEAIFGKV